MAALDINEVRIRCNSGLYEYYIRGKSIAYSKQKMLYSYMHFEPLWYSRGMKSFRYVKEGNYDVT